MSLQATRKTRFSRGDGAVSVPLRQFEANASPADFDQIRVSITLSPFCWENLTEMRIIPMVKGVLVSDSCSVSSCAGRP